MSIKINSHRHNNRVLAAKVTHLATSMIMLLCGIALFVIEKHEIDIKFYLIGVANILIGGAGIFGYFSNDIYRLAFQSDFALGVFNVVFGVMVIADPIKVAELLPLAVAVISLLDGCNKAQMAIEGYKFGMSKWFLVAISAAVEIAMAVGIFAHSFLQSQNVISVPLTLIIVGAVNFWTTMYMVRIKKSKFADEEALKEGK